MQVDYILWKYTASSFQNPIKILNTWISFYVNKNLSLCQYLHSHSSMTPFLRPSLPCIFLLINLSIIINSSSTIFLSPHFSPFLYKTSLSIIFSFCFQISPFLKTFLYFFMLYFPLILPILYFLCYSFSSSCLSFLLTTIS